MFFTYIFILFLIFIILKAVKEVVQLILYGGIPHQKEMSKTLRRVIVKSDDHNKKHRKSLKEISNNYLQTLLVCLGMFLFGYFLFRKILPAFLISLLGLLYPRIKASRDRKRLEDKMLLQFREAILSLASSLKAGSSLQVALQRCEVDLERELRLQKEKPMLDALYEMNSDIQLGKPIDEVLLDFKREYDLEDISQFIDAIIMTRAKGGNLADVISNTAQTISDKILIQQEIQLATVQKRMEAGILTFMPIGIVVILMVLNPGYMRPMYETTLGTVLLFVAVIMLVVNYFIGRKVTNIDI